MYELNIEAIPAPDDSYDFFFHTLEDGLCTALVGVAYFDDNENYAHAFQVWFCLPLEDEDTRDLEEPGDIYLGAALHVREAHDLIVWWHTKHYPGGHKSQ